MKPHNGMGDAGTDLCQIARGVLCRYCIESLTRPPGAIERRLQVSVEQGLGRVMRPSRCGHRSSLVKQVSSGHSRSRITLACARGVSSCRGPGWVRRRPGRAPTTRERTREPEKRDYARRERPAQEPEPRRPGYAAGRQGRHDLQRVRRTGGRQFPVHLPLSRKLTSRFVNAGTRRRPGDTPGRDWGHRPRSRFVRGSLYCF
jgi:hypothetical protein